MCGEPIRRRRSPRGFKTLLFGSGAIAGYDANVTTGLTLEICGGENEPTHRLVSDPPPTRQSTGIFPIDDFTAYHPGSGKP